MPRVIASPNRKQRWRLFYAMKKLLSTTRKDRTCELNVEKLQIYYFQKKELALVSNVVWGLLNDTRKYSINGPTVIEINPFRIRSESCVHTIIWSLLSAFS